MRKLGQIFVDLGFITDDSLEMVIEEQNQGVGNRLIGEIAIAMGLIDEDHLVEALCEQFSMQSFDLDDYKHDPELNAVSSSMVKLYEIVPLMLHGDVLTVATHNPQNLFVKDELSRLLAIEIRLVVAAKSKIKAVITKHFDEDANTFESIVNELRLDNELNESARALEDDRLNLNDIKQFANSKPIRRLLSMVILEAIRMQASDIHFEPYEEEFRIRVNSDGLLHELVPPPRHFASAITTRIKVMANLDISERRLPQDGRIGLQVGGHPIDIRVSVLPTMFGESIVCRLLDKSNVSLDLTKVGMPDSILKSFRELTKKPNGIILVTGPTGSGKTTTLYSALSELNTIDRKTITIEDPVEYDIDGIIQIQVNPDVDVTFSSALRAILRQDPDTLLVGEIRDYETAEIAIQASLTGHIVFGTLHTNDSPSTIVRLRDMGIQNFMINSTVEAILSQRLVKRICANCKIEVNASKEALVRFPKLKKHKFYKGTGCDACKNSGFKGRVGIFELMIMTDAIRELVSSNSSADKIRKCAKASGMKTLVESGLRCAVNGTTTLDEVLACTVDN